MYQTLALATVSLIMVGCNSGSSGPSPDTLSVTVTPTHYLDSANLANQSFRRVRRFAEAGDRVHLVIEVQQLKGGFKRCGNPLIRGPMGDVLAVPEPVDEIPGEFAVYQYHFVAQHSGMYSVEFLNSECRQTGTGAYVEVDWLIYSSFELQIP